MTAPGKIQRWVQSKIEKYSKRQRKLAEHRNELYAESDRGVFADFRSLPEEKQKELLKKGGIFASLMEREGGRRREREGA